MISSVREKAGKIAVLNLYKVCKNKKVAQGINLIKVGQRVS